ncbi:GTP-binding protein 2-like [Hydractinia symbiolongicarpus]|uniref:GTP-binding protein 2-like n=1 Tax=Hydractinia symbiolongicarpus TaxID=13093 RepID=UPI00254FAC25|nr:GTP-binding protein 2-like [Hydractinia symbiolongicarpus]
MLSVVNSKVLSLPPEVEEGNIEYKLKLVNPSLYRLDHLVTQMKWRLQEGDGQAIYEIGVEDNGCMSGLEKDELDSSLETLSKMAERLEAETLTVRKQRIDTTDRYMAEVLVRKIPDNQEFVDIRVACLGNVDVGKSTLLGVLSYGNLDNGRGRARLNMFRHLHEIESGRTSSISHEILGFDSSGKVLNYSDSTAEEICASASKLITFLDLAGHHKYIKTTIFGLTGHSPDIVMLTVAANRGLAGTTKEHLGLAVALNLPFLIVITKVDICSADMLQKTISQLERVLKSAGCKKKLPMVINDEEDVLSAAHNFSTGGVAPIFKVSSVSGHNLKLLRSFYNNLPSIRKKDELEELVKKPVEFQIDEVFSVQKVGPVLAGTLRSGTIHEGDEVLVGPTEDGLFNEVTVSSIHRNRTPCRIIQAGQTACIAVKPTPHFDQTFRRGQVLLPIGIKDDGDAATCLEFEAEVFILFHTTKISKNYQASVHVGNVIQTAIIENITNEKILKTGQRGVARFKFLRQPEYLRKGDRILFREGRNKGIGEITKIFPYSLKRKNSLGDSD